VNAVAQSVENGPTRTCVGCRKAEPAGDLVRLAIGPGGQVAVDHPRRLGGRGAWVHVSLRCVKDAIAKGGIARGLHAGRPSFTAAELAAVLRKRFALLASSLLSASRRAGKAEVGTEAVLAAIRSGVARLVVIATDAADSGKQVEDAVRSATAPPPRARFATKGELGVLWSRETLGVVAVTDSGLAEQIAREVEWSDRLSDDFVG
jgi:predicted RNA-binding protein YlxR (DUF448 family)/ribosomal protein L7Ae-like RNA K-turn-binding protein